MEKKEKKEKVNDEEAQELSKVEAVLALIYHCMKRNHRASAAYIFILLLSSP